jgi:hypothetical protein
MIAKELRALLPLFAASVATMVLASRLGREFVPMAVPAFLLGSAALGAWSIGHEYSHRTLGALLTLPVPRARIWTTKLAVTAPMLVALALVALWVFSGASQQSGVAVGMATYFLPTIAALCITPWLTMASRSAVGGALFTTSIAAIFVIAGDWIGIRKYGYTRDVDAFRMQFLWWTMAHVLATAGHRWRRHRVSPAIRPRRRGDLANRRQAPYLLAADQEGAAAAAALVDRRRHLRIDLRRGRRREARRP